MELRSGKIVSKSLSATDVNGEEVSMPLPVELVERILAMVPFPQIFKARALSKSWHARLSSIASHADDEKKLLALSFQKRVCEWSDKWKTYCPVFLFKDFLIAYDRASKLWRKIPTLSLLPYRAAMNVKADMLRHHMLLMPIAGPLLLLFVTTSDPDIIFVVNIFTGSWRTLPALPRIDGRHGTRIRLVIIGEIYKVIRLYIDVGCAIAWVYDSKSGAWRSKRVEIPEILGDFVLALYDVYLNGVLYAMVFAQRMVWGFLAFDVKDESFNLLQMPHNGVVHSDSYLRYLQIVACNGTVYVAMLDNLETLILVEADLVLRRWSEVIRGPADAVKFGVLCGDLASDGDCIFFPWKGSDMVTPNGKVLSYNVRRDEWSYLARNRILKQCLRSSMRVDFETSFQPGMNPFLKV